MLPPKKPGMEKKRKDGIFNTTCQRVTLIVCVFVKDEKDRDSQNASRYFNYPVFDTSQLSSLLHLSLTPHTVTGN